MGHKSGRAGRRDDGTLNRDQFWFEVLGISIWGNTVGDSILAGEKGVLGILDAGNDVFGATVDAGNVTMGSTAGKAGRDIFGTTIAI